MNNMRKEVRIFTKSNRLVVEKGTIDTPCTPADSPDTVQALLMNNRMKPL